MPTVKVIDRLRQRTLVATSEDSTEGKARPAERRTAMILLK